MTSSSEKYRWTASAEARRNSSVRTCSSISGRRTRRRAETALWYELAHHLVDSVRRSTPELNVQTHKRNFGEAKSAVALRQRFGGQRWSRRESNSVCNDLISNKLERIIFSMHRIANRSIINYYGQIYRFLMSETTSNSLTGKNALFRSELPWVFALHRKFKSKSNVDYICIWTLIPWIE